MKDITHYLLYCKKSQQFILGYMHMYVMLVNAFTPVPFSQQPRCLPAPQPNFFYLVRPLHKVSHRTLRTFSGSSSKLCNLPGHTSYSPAAFPVLLRGYGLFSVKMWCFSSSRTSEMLERKKSKKCCSKKRKVPLINRTTRNGQGSHLHSAGSENTLETTPVALLTG